MSFPDLDPATITSVAALLSAAGLSLKALLDWLRARREADDLEGGHHARIDSIIAQSADAAVVALGKTVDSLQDENARLVKRVTELEQALAARDKKIEDLEGRLRRAEIELRSVADELASLKNHS